MIIDDANKLIFIHIPKCAGMTLRTQLAAINSGNNQYFHLRELDDGMTVDMAHLPLATLKKYFNDDYRKLLDYQSFAIVRDPFERFLSSVYQRLSAYSDINITTISLQALRQEVASIVTYLDNYNQRLLPYDYVHFQPQIDYLKIDGTGMIVSRVFAISEIDQALNFVTDYTGHPITTDRIKSNSSVVYKSSIQAFAVNCGKRLIPKRVAALIPKRILKRINGLAQTEASQRTAALLEDPSIIAFIERYYADDISLFQLIKDR